MFENLNLNFDFDGDGINDSFITQIDTDGDGVNDTSVLYVDSNHDGFIDSNEMQMMFMDTDNDGIFDTQMYWDDVDGNGTLDQVFATDSSITIFHDDDGNGTFETVEQHTDTDGDGVYDTHDTYFDVDGQDGYDVHVQERQIDEHTMIQTVESNIADVENSYSIFMDTDGDNVFDIIETQGDINHDGVVDYVSQIVKDSDGDIITYIFGEDLDGDAVFDKITVYEDTDGDGVWDTTTAYADVNNDGYLEVIPLEYDPAIQAPPGDETNNPPPGYADLDNDGKLDVLPADYDPNEYEDYDDDTYVNYHSVSVDPSKVIGNPGESMRFWEYQHYSGPCAVESQRAMIEELTGQDLDTRDLLRIAAEHGWYQGGTLFQDNSRMLDYYGVNNSGMQDNGNEQVVVDCLNNGGRLLAVVDGKELWGQADSPNANHAVEVIGYYTGDPNDPNDDMVIINDSGCPDGRGAMVPVEQFMNAWEDSNYMYVEAYA